MSIRALGIIAIHALTPRSNVPFLSTNKMQIARKQNAQTSVKRIHHFHLVQIASQLVRTVSEMALRAKSTQAIQHSLHPAKQPKIHYHTTSRTRTQKLLHSQQRVLTLHICVLYRLSMCKSYAQRKTLLYRTSRVSATILARAISNPWLLCCFASFAKVASKTHMHIFWGTARPKK